MEHFIAIVTKGDNIPIVGLLIAVIYLTWVALSEARKNDRLIKDGRKEDVAKRMQE